MGSPVLQKDFSVQNIKSGFKSIGIWLLNPSVVQQHYVLSEAYQQPTASEPMEVDECPSNINLEARVTWSKMEEDGQENSHDIEEELVERERPNVEHFFIDPDPSDPSVPDDLGGLDRNVDAIQSITHFFTLPSCHDLAINNQNTTSTTLEMGGKSSNMKTPFERLIDPLKASKRIMP